MIQIKSEVQDIYIYKSNWDCSTSGTSGTNSLVLVNDLSNESLNIPFVITDFNFQYTALELDFSTSGITLPYYGFYTLNIYLNENIQYTERCQYNNTDVIIDNTTYSEVKEQNGYTKIRNIV